MTSAPATWRFGPLCALLLLAACARQPVPATDEPVRLSIVTSDSCGPLMEELAEAYQSEYPWVTIEIETFNTSVAEAYLRSGAADLAAVSWPEETPSALWLVPFATDAVVIVAHPTVNLQELTTEDLRDTLRGRVGELDDGTPLQIVSREEGAATRTALERLVLDEREITSTSVVLPDDEDVLETVAATPGAVGYVSLGHLTGQAHVLPVNGTLAARSAGSGYPLLYPIFLASRSEPAGDARQFAQWVLGPEGQRWVTRWFAPP
jgi:phosphate transport system substrate-binding protein